MAEGAQGAGAGLLQVNAALAAIPIGAPALSVAPLQITVGSAATLTWASYGTSSCTASGAWSGTQATAGTAAVTPATVGSSTYSLLCTGPSGTSAVSTVTVMVEAAAGHHGGGQIDGATLALLLAVLAAPALFRLVRFRPLK